MMNGYDDDYQFGGKGGAGGMTGFAGNPGTILSSTLKAQEGDIDNKQRDGRNSRIEEFYPTDECELDCYGGYVDPEDGIHTYLYNDDENFVPDILMFHFPTCKDIGIIDKSKFDIEITSRV